MVPETGLEPVQEVIPRDFKSLASTNSATPAEINLKWRHLPDSNRRWRFCRPLPYLLAKVPTKEFRLKKDIKKWSGKRDSDPRRLPWQGSTLPLSYSRSGTRQFSQKLLNVKFFLLFFVNLFRQQICLYRCSHTYDFKFVVENIRKIGRMRSSAIVCVNKHRHVADSGVHKVNAPCFVCVFRIEGR